VITVDLAWLVAWIKPILAIGLLTIGVVFFAIPWIKDLISRFVSVIPNILPPTPAPTPKTRNSDAPAPAGIGEFLKTIEETSPNANPSIWWEYAKAEMTEAQVAIAEAKLARRNDCAPNVVKPEEVKN
jgi:hypothetical protein